MKMRAARMVELGRLVCEEAEVRPPGEGEVLVRTERASICGSDLHVVFNGLTLFPPPAPPGFPGHEGVGEVMESRSPAFAVGDRVLTCPWPTDAGCFADYQTIPATSCLKLPAYDGPVEHLLMAQQLGAVLFAFRMLNTDVHGKTVMVLGQGSAGCFFSYLAKRAGAARVIASDKSEARLAACTGFGTDVAVRAERENVLHSVLEHTSEAGADVVIEAVGSSEALLQSVDLVRVGGEVLYFGLPETEEPVPFNYNVFFRRKVRAVCDYGAQHEPDLVSFQHALHLIASRQIDVAPMVSHMLPIEQIEQAMHIAHDRSDNALKVSLDLS